MPKKPAIFRTAFATYTVGRPVGNGGSGAVYEVRDEDGERLALKVLHPNIDRRKLKRFKNEASFCQKFVHANVVQIIDYGIADTEQGSQPFYVMPFYEATLRDLIRQHVPHAEVLQIFDHLLSGVEAAHLLNVIHRDLKPENVLFDASTRQLIVADFGIASFSQEDLYTAVETRDNDRLANFCYAAPEQRDRGREVTSRADIFALGLMLNEMFTGMVPTGTNFKRIGEISERHGYLDGIVDRMLDQDPDSRPASIRQVKEELLARGNEFTALQKLNEKKTEVVSESSIDDPIVSDPITIVEIDYQGGYLVFTLSQTPNPPWIRAFVNPRTSYQSVVGFDPSRFQFSDGTMRILAPSNENMIPMVNNNAKAYVQNANQAYASDLQHQAVQQAKHLRQSRQAEIAEAERRARILKMVRP